MRKVMVAPRHLLAFLLALLAGCATAPPGGPAAPTPPEGTIEQPTPGQRDTLIPAAVQDLVSKARDSSAAGEHDRAADYLERALRIVPRNPVVWQNLAVVRYRQGQYAQAESLALKSIALAGNNPDLKRQDWALVGEARHLQGDEVGAKEARARAAAFSGHTGQP